MFGWKDRNNPSPTSREKLESILNEALGAHLLGGATQAAREPNTTVSEHLEKAFDELRSRFDDLKTDLIAIEARAALLGVAA